MSKAKRKEKRNETKLNEEIANMMLKTIKSKERTRSKISKGVLNVLGGHWREQLVHRIIWFSLWMDLHFAFP